MDSTLKLAIIKADEALVDVNKFASYEYVAPEGKFMWVIQKPPTPELEGMLIMMVDAYEELASIKWQLMGFNGDTST